MNCFHSARFGELRYAHRDVINLPDGLIGLPRLRRWILLEMERPVPLKWLQSLDDGNFGFPVAEPGFFASAYEVAPPPGVLARLGCDSAEELAVLIITTVHEGGSRLTGNLAAPLLIHLGTRLGAQVVIDDERWSLRQEIDYLKFGLAVQGETAAEGTEEPATEPALVGAGPEKERQLAAL